MPQKSDCDALMHRALKEVIEAQQLIKNPGDRHEVALLLTLAEVVAEKTGKDVVAEDLLGFAQAIRDGLFE